MIMNINEHLRLILLRALFDYKNKCSTLIEFCLYSLKKLTPTSRHKSTDLKHRAANSLSNLTGDSIFWSQGLVQEAEL